MDIERMLVTQVASTQAIESVLSQNIDAAHFLQRAQGDTSPKPMPGEVFSWMCEHWRRFKSAPSLQLTQLRWPDFEFIATTDTLDALTHTFKGQIKRRALISGIRELSEIADDPSKWADAEIHAFEVAANLARTVPTSTITRLSDSFSRLALHKQMQETGRAPGVTLIAPDLDALTYGIQQGELCIWEGFLGVGKSTMAMTQSAQEYAQRGKTSLVFSLEMQGQKLANRWDAAMAGFRYRALKFMEMRDEDYERWARFAEAAFEARFEKDVLVIDDIARCTPERIHAEVERWRPNFFIVDTIDEVRAPSFVKSFHERGDWAARELKAVCRATRLPGIGVAQAGRDAEEEGATLGNIAQSITIARKADLVVGLHATPAMKRANKIEVRMLKNRDGEGDGLSYDYYRDPASLLLRPWLPSDNTPPPPPRAQAPV